VSHSDDESSASPWFLIKSNQTEFVAITINESKINQSYLWQ